uniref:Uncharacterized protein n=1 Tax=uncultured marine virus TaxID=186617 RepID=A0A0F7L6Q8_9VIRU|nr:hypothetical protein [uncultured marine virus]
MESSRVTAAVIERGLPPYQGCARSLYPRSPPRQKRPMRRLSRHRSLRRAHAAPPVGFERKALVALLDSLARRIARSGRSPPRCAPPRVIADL